MPHISALLSKKVFLKHKKGGDMTSRDWRDVIGGILMIAIGLFAAFYAQRYTLGTLQRMGPGYFPVALGVLLAVLGVFVVLPALFRSGTHIKIQWKSLVWVIASLLTFALLLNQLGLIFTTIITVLVGTLASNLPVQHKLILSLAVTAVTYLIFSFGLGMLMPVWPWSYQ
jgi:hypothetical protein